MLLVKVLTTRMLFKFAIEREVKQIQIFSDSSLVINWMKGSLQVHSVHLRALADQLQEVARSFDLITFTHVY